MKEEALAVRARSEKEQLRMAQGYGRGCASVVLAAVAVVGVSACNGRGGGGPTTVIQTVVPTSSASAAPTSTTPSVSPINDRSQLCSRAMGRIRDITGTSDTYWNLAGKSGFGDAEVSDAGDKFRVSAEKTIPILRGLIGAEAPKDVADAIKQFADAADKFSDAAGAHSSADEINPLASSYGDALDAVKAVCKH